MAAQIRMEVLQMLYPTALAVVVEAAMLHIQIMVITMILRKGESYLELSKTEEDMVEKVCSEFNKVIVIINASNAWNWDG